MAYPNYRSQFGDTTYTKVFVGGLAWETPTDKMRRYFEQFGEILEAVVITDKVTGRSKGYGFVTFRDPDSARKACEEPNPVIDGRKANCNVAALGRPRPSPPRVLNAGGRTQGVNPYHGSGPQGAPLFNQVGATLSTQPPMPPPAPPVIYPPYGYTAYTPDYGYHHTLYNPHIQAQYYQHQQMYGASSSAVGSPYYYGYNSLQASPSPRGGPAYTATQAQFSRAPFYMHYPAQGEGPFTMLPQPTTGPAPTRQQPVPPSSSSSDSQVPAQESSSTTGGMGVSNISESQ